MTIFAVLLVFLLFVSDGTSYKRESELPGKNGLKAVEGNNRLSMDSNYTNSCNQSDTCEGIDQAQLSAHDLQNRSCMCDEQCTMYGDCCKDSKFQMNSSLPQIKFECVSTATHGFVYMIASCPSAWNESQEIQNNCHTMENPLKTLNVWILTPVTAYQSGITYKNMFCAFCNSEMIFQFWELGVSCTPANSSNKSESENLLDPDNILGEMSASGAYPVSWPSPAEDTTYHCSWHGKPKNDTQMRYCIPQPEVTCTSSTNCTNSTSYVHIDNSTNQKGNTSTRSFGCYHSEQVHMKSPSAVTILNPFIVGALCQQIPQDAAIFHQICEKPKPKSDVRVGYSTCFPRKGCLIWQWFVINETVTFLDEDTIYLKDRQTSYPRSEWQHLHGTNQIFVCGSYITRSTFHQVIFVLDDWISEIFIKLSIICLLLHLLIFQQLPQMRNFSGKNLAMFCATLLVAFLCWEIGPRLAHCQITAVILHYSLLSCFTWSLLLSYDCWHTLLLATKELRSAGGKHTLRFCIYCIISWLIPGLIVSTALYFELSSKVQIPCEKKIGYGQYGQCFIGQIFGLITFFIAPASCMFLGNICFFIFTSIMIYGNRKSSVNPNSKIDFLMYIRLALMMGVTWTTGTLAYVTDYKLIGLMFSALNMSQGVLIFFAFTFKQKTLQQLLEKYKKFPKVAWLLQIFIRESVSEAPTQMTSSSGLSKETGSSSQVTLVRTWI